MGVFNTIGFTCPRCDAVLEAQSKVDGGCSNYSSNEVPPAIAADIEGDTLYCEACHEHYSVVRKPRQNVSMGLV